MVYLCVHYAINNNIILNNVKKNSFFKHFQKMNVRYSLSSKIEFSAKISAKQLFWGKKKSSIYDLFGLNYWKCFTVLVKT